MTRPATFAVVALLLCGCALPPRPVVRVVDGREVPGRFVSVSAYALYARGVVLEEEGDLAGAEDAYRRALEHDPRSAHILVRLGALGCRRGWAQAERAFQAAEAADPDYEMLWRARARCALRRNRAPEAARSAELAFRLDPDQPETTLLLARVREQQQRPDEAQQLLEALVVRTPDSLEAWRALRELSRAYDPNRLFRHADRQVRRLLERLQPPGPSDGARSDATPVDDALASGHLSAARHLATQLGIGAGELALRAVAVGRADLGREQAHLVLSADPTDGDAWVALVAAADLSRNDRALRDALPRLAARPVPPGPLGSRLLGELLDRRVGRDAANAWTAAGAASSTPAVADRPASPE